MKQNSTVLLVIAGAVAAGGIYYVRNKKAAQENAAQQAPALSAMSNYTVPPNIAAQVDNTGGINYPGGQNGTGTVTISNGQPMPLPYNT